MQSNTTVVTNSPEVVLERRGRIGIIRLNRGKTRNPLTHTLTASMMSALEEAEQDASLRALILTGDGTVFCAGAELGKLVHPDDVDAETQFLAVRGHNRIVQRLHEIDLPIIAAVNGPAIGGGAALGLACDIALAATEASYHFAFGRIGLGACDMGCSYHLPKIVGTALANYWLYTGAIVSAEEGKSHGLFLDVVPREDLLERAFQVAEQIADAAPRRATAMTKLSLARAADADLQTVLGYEAYTQNYLFTRNEHKEMLRALMTKLGML